MKTLLLCTCLGCIFLCWNNVVTSYENLFSIEWQNKSAKDFIIEINRRKPTSYTYTSFSLYSTQSPIF